MMELLLRLRGHRRGTRWGMAWERWEVQWGLRKRQGEHAWGECGEVYRVAGVVEGEVRC